MLKRQLAQDHREEHVDDSEPEREEAKKRRWEERRKRGKQNFARKADNLEVIEVTDTSSDGSSSPIARDARREKVVEESSHRLREPVVALTANASSYNCSSQATTIADDESEVSGTEAEDSSEQTRMKLGRYAYSTSSLASAVRSRSMQSITDVTVAVEIPNTSVARKGATKNVASYLNFSERQLKSVLKCVSCDLTWTTRKTVAQKIFHMRSCMKKTHLTEETMKALLSREIQTDLRHVGCVHSRTKENEELPPRSFLQTLVKECDVQKGGRRRENICSSIKGVAESQKDICDRAKVLLRRSSFDHSSRDSPSPTQTIGKSSLIAKTRLDSYYEDMEEELPHTQPIAKSTLASSLSRSRIGTGIVSLALELMSDAPSFDSPPATQTFSFPKPSSVRKCTSLLGADLLVDTVSPYPSPPLEVLYDPFQNNDETTATISEARLEYDTREADDGAVLDFYPDHRSVQYFGLIESNEDAEEDGGIPNLLLSNSIKLASQANPESLCNKHNDDRDEHNEVKGKTRRRLKQIKGDTHKGRTPTARERDTKKKVDEESLESQSKQAISDEDLCEKLRTMVLDDEKLYLRVLRYEPIHFDVFLELAQALVKDYDLGVLGLRVKLRTFLDKQAIHYYGITPGGGRGRR